MVTARSRLAGKEALVRDWIEKQPDLTLAELCARLAEHGVAIKISALWHQLNQWNLSFKKTLHASEQERQDVQPARVQWKKKSIRA